MADISLVSRVKTRRKNSYKQGKNNKKATRRATSANKMRRYSVFGEGGGGGGRGNG